MADSLDIDAASGPLRGVLAGDVREWRGIPFAAPPVGDLRFRAPAPVTRWMEVRDASAFGPVSPQDREGPFSGAEAETPRSEDCLSINVAAPTEPATGLPVMVYIQGGGYSVGSPRDTAFRGINFARRGVVHVTFNYRLNAFGYLDFSEFGADNNLGLRDQVAALEWIRDNIAAFGGDPANVTVYGESSGANAVTTLMTLPAARGLFARAIAQSPPSNAVYRPELTRAWAREFIEILGVTPGDEAAALRTADATALVTAARILFMRVPDEYPGDQAFSPVIDGDYLPEHPVEALRAGRGHPVPLIIGSNDREGSVFWGKRFILATSPSRIAGLLSGSSAAAAAELRSVYRLPRRRGRLDFGGDFAFWLPTHQIAAGHSAIAPTWMYRLDYAPPLLHLLGVDATHGADLLTVFDRARTSVAKLTTLLGGRRALAGVSERMQDYWLRFATDGTVDAAWPQHDASTRASLVFDNPDRVENDSRADRRVAWDDFIHLH
jgi:para-nitrobenzyl esterase